VNIRLNHRRIALAVAAGLLLTTGALPAYAGVDPHAAPSVVHFDLAAGQMPENIVLGPDGATYLTFAGARQVAVVAADHSVRILATMPLPADGGGHTPVLGFALTTGLVRTGDGTLYFLYASGSAATGLYRLRPGGAPHLIAALPADGLPNGLALDEHARRFYVTDSVRGAVYTVALAGGAAQVWSSAPELAATGFLGVNGIKVHRGAVWVTDLDRGTLLRIPLRDGHAGPVETRATGLAGADDFTFPDPAGDTVLAALNPANEVVRVTPGGATQVVLTAADGLENPTSVAVRAGRVYVPSAAYTTATDPNLLTTALQK
jgi:hypothetical protein